MIGFVGITDMHGASIGIRKNRHGQDIHFPARTHHPYGYFPPVGDQYFFDHIFI
jgi:hypothetical protein